MMIGHIYKEELIPVTGRAVCLKDTNNFKIRSSYAGSYCNLYRYGNSLCAFDEYNKLLFRTSALTSEILIRGDYLIAITANSFYSFCE